MKILIYSLTCQPLSSSNKLLIKHINVVFFVKNTKKTISKSQIHLENLIIILYLYLKLNFIFYTQRTNEKEYTFFWLCVGANTSFPFNAK